MAATERASGSAQSDPWFGPQVTTSDAADQTAAMANYDSPPPLPTANGTRGGSSTGDIQFSGRAAGTPAKRPATRSFPETRGTSGSRLELHTSVVVRRSTSPDATVKGGSRLRRDRRLDHPPLKCPGSVQPYETRPSYRTNVEPGLSTPATRLPTTSVLSAPSVGRFKRW